MKREENLIPSVFVYGLTNSNRCRTDIKQQVPCGEGGTTQGRCRILGTPVRLRGHAGGKRTAVAELTLHPSIRARAQTTSSQQTEGFYKQDVGRPAGWPAWFVSLISFGQPRRELGLHSLVSLASSGLSCTARAFFRMTSSGDDARLLAKRENLADNY